MLDIRQANRMPFQTNKNGNITLYDAHIAEVAQSNFADHAKSLTFHLLCAFSFAEFPDISTFPEKMATLFNGNFRRIYRTRKDSCFVTKKLITLFLQFYKK